MPMRPKTIAKTVSQSRKDADKAKQSNKPAHMQGYAEASITANNKAADMQEQKLASEAKKHPAKHVHHEDEID